MIFNINSDDNTITKIIAPPIIRILFFLLNFFLSTGTSEDKNTSPELDEMSLTGGIILLSSVLNISLEGVGIFSIGGRVLS